VFEYDYLIVSDGGSRGNGSKLAEAYGSYQLSARTGQQETIRLQFGHGTNNEAEYKALLAALEDLVGRITKASKAPAGYSLIVQTDSQLVANQVTGAWKVKAANLAALCDRAKKLLSGFGQVTVQHVPRAEIVRVLGH
jgi:ribonuclease HI